MDISEQISDGASRLIPGVPLDVIALGCTSASIVIGQCHVQGLMKKGRGNVKTTTPILAFFDALNALNASRVGIVCP